MAWVPHPLAEPFLRFNLLPSLTLHPSRMAEVLPPAWHKLVRAQQRAGAPAVPHLHRHCSAALAEALQLLPVPTLDDPALPLAMLPAAAFERLVLLCGITLAGPRIRRTISRDEVATLLQQLGEEGLRFARTEAAAVHPGLDESAPAWHTALAAETSAAWGAALLARAFETATPPVAQRALLRLPADAVSRNLLPAHTLKGPQALTLARTVLQLIDPPWLSSFPATH